VAGVLRSVKSASGNASILVVGVPHSHQDVGWLMTPQSYAETYVRRIYAGVTQLLRSDPAFVFTAAEMYYLAGALDEAGAADRAVLQTAADQGRLGFWGAGWTQADMGTNSVAALVNNLAAGHTALATRLGVAAARGAMTGASLDPFGVSPAYGRLLLAAGADSWVFTRVPPWAADSLAASRAAEFLWSPASSPVRGPGPAGAASGQRWRLFSETLLWYYCSPSWAQWEGKPAPTPEQVDQAAVKLVADARQRAAAMRSPVVFVPLGCDFAWQQASSGWAGVLAVMRRANETSGVTGVRATVATARGFLALRAAAAAAPADLPGLTAYPSGASRFSSATAPAAPPLTGWPGAALFPEATGNTTAPGSPGAIFWTGYFSSRPLTKQRAVDVLAAVLAADRLAVAAGDAAAVPAMTGARQDVAVLTHHDAGTGTFCVPGEGCTGGGQTTGDHEVGRAYAGFLDAADAAAAGVTAAAASRLCGNASGPAPALWSSSWGEAARWLLNGSAVTVRVVSSLPSNGGEEAGRTELLRLPVPLCGANATDAATGASLVTQLVPVLGVYSGSPFSYQLLVEVPLVRPMEPRDVIITVSESAACPAPDPTGAALADVDAGGRTRRVAPPAPTAAASDGAEIVIRGGGVSAGVNTSSTAGGLRWVQVAGMPRVNVSHRVWLYQESRGDAYAFRPDGDGPGLLGVRLPASSLVDPEAADSVPPSSVVTGPLVDEVRLAVSHGVRVVVRVVKGGAAWRDLGATVEVDVFTGPLPQGTAAVSELVTSINNALADPGSAVGAAAPALWTDLNGIEPTRFAWNASRLRGGNQFPAQSSVHIRGQDLSARGGEAWAGGVRGVRGAAGEEVQLSVVLPRSHGVTTTPEAGRLELMHARRSAGHAVSHAVVNDDTGRARSRLLLTAGPAQAANRWRHEAAKAAAAPPSLLFARHDEPARACTPAARQGVALPAQVRVVAMRMVGPDEPFWAEGGGTRVRVTLMHSFAQGEDAQLSVPVTVDVAGLVAGAAGADVGAASCTETTLTGLWPVDEAPRAAWQGDDAAPGSASCLGAVTLSPLEVRAFDVSLRV